MGRDVRRGKEPGASDVAVDRLIRLALAEDLPGPDVTTEAVGLSEQAAEGVILAEEGMVVSGLEIARRVFRCVDPGVLWASEISDGDRAGQGDVLARVEGSAGALLAGERTALNFLQRLSGVASMTARFVELAAGYPAVILDTRKTTPGWRKLEKDAVRHGGGTNHRYSLTDGILIKDNHIRLAGGVGAAVRAARRSAPPGMTVEVETSSLAEIRAALDAGAGRILVDNTSPEDLQLALEAVAGRAEVEVSGGITEENLRDMAATGVDMISVGALTHSAPAVDISMDIKASQKRVCS